MYVSLTETEKENENERETGGEEKWRRNCVEE